MFEKQSAKQSYLGGIFLILMGIFYFLPAWGFISWGSVGLLFAFIPVVWVVHRGYYLYQRDGELNGRVLAHLMWGLFPFALMGLIFAGVNIGQFWPLIFVFIGITMLFNSR